MLTIDYDANRNRSTWWFCTLSTRQAIVVMKCSNGHLRPLTDYEILSNGYVLPLVICHCGYHEFVRLKDYEHRIKQNG